MLQLFLALLVVIAMLLTYAGAVWLVCAPDSALWRTRRRLRESSQVRRETADLDREYASLVDEHRYIP